MRMDRQRKGISMTAYALGEYSPQFPPDDAYWVAPNATLIGRVQLMKNASVWFGVVARGDNDPIVIGEDTNVQDNSVMHTDPGIGINLGKGVTVGHMVILHSCSVGDNSLIGMGSVLLTGARIGANCLIGANTLIAEGKVIPDNSVVVGAPGKIIRQVGEREMAILKASAQVYVQNWQRFRRDLKPAG
jgi:carbonic anhydrase/acetyltransferase-like protein (isoleucine patch superfamily)